MKYIITYSRFDNDLDVPENAFRDVLLKAYFEATGGLNVVVNHFLKYLNIVPDFTEEAQVVESENKNE